MKKKAFTLLEVIVSITLFFIIMVVIISLYTKMVRLKYNIQARQSLIQNSYDTMEKINVLLRDYTIDYEEYFNRRNVGCNNSNAGLSFTRNIGTGGYCSDFTADGNSSYDYPNRHTIYYCSSSSITENHIIEDPSVHDGSGCAQSGQQSFGEYYWQFLDVKGDEDGDGTALGDGDDNSVMKGPAGVLDATEVKELYLISQDKKQRLWIRKILIESGDWNRDGITGNVDSDKLYTLQILKLRGFDAGEHHDFDAEHSSGVYDGNIDTWTCDYAQGFVCYGSGIGALYSGYAMPSDSNDGWVNLFDQDLTVSDWNLNIFPTKNPAYSLAQSENATQINPYFTVSLTNKLYGKIWFKKLGMPSLDAFQFSLQTTFSTKNFYTK